MKGFTLLEIVIAMMILSYSTVALLGKITQAVRMTGKARVLVTAAQLGRNLLNEIQLEGKFTKEKKQGQFEDFEGFEYEYEIEAVKLDEVMPLDKEQKFADVNFDRLHKIRLNVYWEQGGSQGNYEIFSYLFTEKS